MPDKITEQKQRSQTPTLGVSFGSLEFCVCATHTYTNGDALISVIIRDDEYPEPAITHISLNELNNLVGIVNRLEEDFCREDSDLPEI